MISIIMPVYNNERFITEAIESVLKQTYSNWELIIVDDGSTDGTRDVIMKYVSHKVHYIYQANQGPSVARNKGLDLAKGEYIAFLDSDDLYAADKLKEQLQFLESHPEIDIVYNDINVVDESLNHLYYLKSEGVYPNQHDFLAMLLFRQIVPLPPSIMARAECFRSGIRFNAEYVHGEDYDLTLKLARKYCYGYLPKPLYIYRRHESNLTNSHQKQLRAEVDVISKLGYAEIERIVEESTFPASEKKLLLAKIYIKLNNYQRAETFLLELLNTDYHNPYIYFYLGNCAYVLNHFDQSKKYYKLAISYDENMTEGYNNLGCVYGVLGELDKAIQLFDIALSKRPNYMDAKYNKEQINLSNPSWKITTRELRKTLTSYR